MVSLTRKWPRLLHAEENGLPGVHVALPCLLNGSRQVPFRLKQRVVTSDHQTLVTTRHTGSYISSILQKPG